MNHLTPAEFVDLLDGRLSAERRDHLRRCESCCEEAAALQAVVREVRVDESEPSPVFWEHFRARTEARIAAAPAPARWWHLWTHTPGRVALAGAATIALLVGGPRILPSSSGGLDEAGGEAAHVQTLDDAVAEEAWAQVRAAAEQVSWDEVREAGVTTRPGRTDGELLRLNDAERRQLLLLLEEALKRDGA